MWYKFIEGEPRGRLRIDRVQVAWYDMDRNGDCFDEDWIMHQKNKPCFLQKQYDIDTLHKIGMNIPYIETDINSDKCNKSRVFIHMDDGDVYELLVKKLSRAEFKECNNFYGGRKEHQWFSEMMKPTIGEWVVVRDEDGKEYDCHQWNGHAWYSYIINDDGTCDGWRTDVDIISWRYQE